MDTDPLIPLIELLLGYFKISAFDALLFSARFLGVSAVLGPLLNRAVPYLRTRAALTVNTYDDRFVAGLQWLSEALAWLNVLLPRIASGLSNKDARPNVRKGPAMTVGLVLLVTAGAFGLTLQGCSPRPTTPAQRAHVSLVSISVVLDATDIAVDRIASNRVRVCLEEMRTTRATDTSGYDECVSAVTNAARALAVVRAALVMADRRVEAVEAGTFDGDPCGAVDNVLVEVNNAIASLRALGPEAIEQVTSLTSLLPLLGHRACDAAVSAGR